MRDETTNPTFFGTIQPMFKPYQGAMMKTSTTDPNSPGEMHFDLCNYDAVRKRAAKIHDVLQNGDMPKAPIKAFTPAQVGLVRAWITQGYVKGTMPPPVKNVKLKACSCSYSYA